MSDILLLLLGLVFIIVVLRIAGRGWFTYDRNRMSGQDYAEMKSRQMHKDLDRRFPDLKGRH